MDKLFGFVMKILVEVHMNFMKKSTTMLALVCILTISMFTLVSATSPISETELNEFKDVYNKHADQASNIIISIFGNENAVLYVDNYDPVFFKMKNGYIIDIGFGELPDKTMNVYTDEETIKEMTQGKTTFHRALREGKIRYEGVDLISSIKAGVANLFIGISSWFG